MMRKLFGIMIGLVVVIFAVFWTMTASNMNAPGFFSIFGVLFVIIAIIFVLKVLFSPNR